MQWLHEYLNFSCFFNEDSITNELFSSSQCLIIAIWLNEIFHLRPFDWKIFLNTNDSQENFIRIYSPRTVQKSVQIHSSIQWDQRWSSRTRTSFEYSSCIRLNPCTSFDKKGFTWKYTVLIKIFFIISSFVQVNVCKNRHNDQWHHRDEESSPRYETFSSLFFESNLLNHFDDEQWRVWIDAMPSKINESYFLVLAMVVDYG